MDFLKEALGVEVQMGKYSFLTYDIVAKMVIFRNLGITDCGIEICPTAAMLPYMSSGIGAFEQVRWDLEARGANKNFDVPVLVLGIEDEVIFSQRQTSHRAIDSSYKPASVTIDRYSKLTTSILERVRETGLNPDKNG